MYASKKTFIRIRTIELYGNLVEYIRLNKSEDVFDNLMLKKHNYSSMKLVETKFSYFCRD